MIKFDWKIAQSISFCSQDPDDRIPNYPPPWNDPAKWPNPEFEASEIRKLGVKIYAVAVPPNAGAGTTPSTKMIGNQFTMMRNVLVNLTGGHDDQVVGFDEYMMIPGKINALLTATKDCVVKPREFSVIKLLKLYYISSTTCH